MNRDIAIIGMAGRFPEASNIGALFNNLTLGKDSVRPLSSKQMQERSLPENEEYVISGFLDNVDKFDHKLFNISLAEAETMSPIQRLLLEVTHEAMENSGYGSRYFNGTNTAVLVGETRDNYFKHAVEFSPTLLTGNAKEYVSARIARHFNLTGNALMVDTACSSGLIALQIACNELVLEDADHAIVCGANLHLFPQKGAGLGLDVYSPDGKSKAFSAEANGMSNGEAVVCVLLKRLDKAIRDQDIIHAVVKAVASNHNANRSASISAPDSRSQAEVILNAWQKAGVSPMDIGFIEAHGSGTKLGDSLEVDGMNLAFRVHTDAAQICPISTIKSNTGHGLSAAGLCSLVKTVLSLKHKLIFPTIHFENPSELIDFTTAAVYVNNELREWSTDGRKRIAGISSTGLSGSNCHVILEEAPERSEAAVQPNSPSIITLSSATREGLRTTLTQLGNKLSATEGLHLQDVSYTLNTGRGHYPNRYAVVAETVDILRERLLEAERSAEQWNNVSESALIYIFSDHDHQSMEDLKSRLISVPAFAQAYRACIANRVSSDNILSFAVQYSVYCMLAEFGMGSTKVVGIGIGKWISKIIIGELSLEQAMDEAAAYQFEPILHMEERLTRLIQRETAESRVVFLTIGQQNSLAASLKAMMNEEKLFIALDGQDWSHSVSPHLEIMRILYQNGIDIDWQRFHKHYPGMRIELTTYSFEPVRCWLRDKPIAKSKVMEGKKNNSEAKIKQLHLERVSAKEQLIAALWSEVLEQDIQKVSDDFFALGGDSLKATVVIKRLNEYLEISLEFEDLFDYPTISSLAKYIETCLSTTQKIMILWKEVLKVDRVKETDDFFMLGGHSLMANHLLALIEDEFELELNFEDIYNHPTVHELTVLLESKLETKLPLADSQEVHMKILDGVAPFSNLYFKSCFYNSFFAGLQYFKQDILHFMVNEMVIYNEREQGMLGAKYISCEDSATILKRNGLEVLKKDRSKAISSDLVASILKERPVVVWVDSYYEPFRSDAYRQKHIKHTLLVYGFDLKERIFHIIEHENHDSLVYKPMTISFDALIESYQGYIKEYPNDGPTYFEIVGTDLGKHSPVYNCRRKYLDNFLQKQQDVQHANRLLLEMADQFSSDEGEAFIAEHAKMLVDGITEIVNAKQVERYKQIHIFGDSVESTLIVNEVISNWNHIRSIINKYLFSGKLKQHHLQSCSERLGHIALLEERFHDLHLNIQEAVKYEH